MLARAMSTKPINRRSPPPNHTCRSRSFSFSEYDDFAVGFTEDLPLIFTDGGTEKSGCSESQVTLRQVLRSSVGVIGQNGRLGLTEKVVLLDGRICALKRFRKVGLRRREFGRRIVRVGLVSSECKFLVPMHAYFYAKRIKFVVCHYYPMGSLDDLLASARKEEQTPLNWNQRLNIIHGLVQAIEFIHTRSSTQDKQLKMNIHGNIKASNVLINIDFTARLSDYGFAQLAERVEVSDTGQRKTPPRVEEGYDYSETFSQKSDIYNFGIIVLDILTAGKTKGNLKDIQEDETFEFPMEGNERIDALRVLEIGKACLNKSPDARPNIQKILRCLGELF